MSAYDPLAWGSFATAEVGATAGLTGLLFVAVSINLDRILSFSKLPARAAETLVVLVLILVESTLVLVPQSSRLIGGEAAALAAAVSAVTLRVQIRHGPDHPDDPSSWFASRVAATQAPTALFIVGGCTLAVRWGGGFYWFVPGTVFGIVGAVYSAWVLLVEIVRQNPEKRSGG